MKFFIQRWRRYRRRTRWCCPLIATRRSSLASTPKRKLQFKLKPSGQFLFSLRCLSAVAAAVARRVKICCLRCCDCCCCGKLCWVIKSAVDNDDGASLDRQPCRAHLPSQQLAFVAHRTLRFPLSALTTHHLPFISVVLSNCAYTHAHRHAFVC